MPFTPSHPVAVLPFVHWRRLLHLDATCLVVGSMAPDFEYFVYGHLVGRLGHSLIGLFVWCLPMTLVVAALYHWLVKWPLLLVAPRWVTARSLAAGAPWPARWSAGFVVSCIASALIGAFSHLVWDAFTHVDGFFVRRIPILGRVTHVPGVGYLELARILQHVSSLTGLAILGALAVHALRRREPVALPEVDRRAPRAIIIALSIVLAAALCYRLVGAHNTQIGDLIVAVMSGGLGGTLLASVIVRADALRFRAKVSA